MKNGYDQFFRKARKVATDQQGHQGKVKLKKQPLAPRQLDLSTEDLEQQIRRRMKMPPLKKKKKASIPWKMMGVSFIGLLIAIWGFYNYEQVENIVKNIEITMNGEALAADTRKTATPSPGANIEEAAATEAAKPADIVDIAHLQKLNERKKELDAREEELNRIEAELQVQKEELEKRLKELEEMRTKISSILEERVKVDDQKVETLVQMYTNMKPPQAAKIFENMDEDLAIEILGRMKKKNAADIMNLLKPEKAQVLSEMFAGYKRRTPASK